ncbi:hypothetical protein [Desulfoscipio gibsoniae]
MPVIWKKDPDSTVKINIETIDGAQTPVVVTEEEYPGFYDISSEVTPMGTYAEPLIVMYILIFF